MRDAEIEAFLTHLAHVRNVSASTHRQALSAIFLYREVIDTELPWMIEICRPKTRQRLPEVFMVSKSLRALSLVDSRLTARGNIADVRYFTALKRKTASA
jgi:hypothetical protein